MTWFMFRKESDIFKGAREAFERGGDAEVRKYISSLTKQQADILVRETFEHAVDLAFETLLRDSVYKYHSPS